MWDLTVLKASKNNREKNYAIKNNKHCVPPTGMSLLKL
jgi:hypothetical protein